MMIEMRRIDELAARLGALLPPGAQQFRTDLEGQFKAVLEKGLKSMDLVTREDFEIQKAALERASVKLQALEERLGALERGS